ncbi:MAG: aspartate carbamoyltransferase catalytic subunit [Legionellaceae bacterium]|nr:aspartate carbamoyltransferase catalytic subunit [Legionellaceae bacterium]
MMHFLDIAQLTSDDIARLVHLASQFRGGRPAVDYAQHTVAQLFYENSTRTRISFEMAAKNLGARVVNVDVLHSSEKKGESMEDTLLNLRAMGIRYFVIRHAQEHILHRLAHSLVSRDVHIINAGDGKHAHPSQAMLDLMTIRDYQPRLSACKIVLVGNLRHSRVANSLQQVLQKSGAAELVLVAPPVWQPTDLYFGQVTEHLTDALRDADVVIGLRVQHERLAADEVLDLATYRAQFAITPERMRLAKPHAILMHPGPVNRGVEMDTVVVDSPQSKILEQVANGVWMRMAILATVMDANPCL